MYQFDLSLFYAIHSIAGHSPFVDAVIVCIGQYLIYGVLAALACAFLYEWYTGKRERPIGYIIAILAAFIARYVVASDIRLAYPRERPFEALGVSHILIHDSVSSFPSGHAIFAFALAAVLYQYNKTLALCVGGAGLLIGIARVAGGIHYPSDILGGIVLGILTGLGVWKLWTWVKR